MKLRIVIAGAAIAALLPVVTASAAPSERTAAAATVRIAMSVSVEKIEYAGGGVDLAPPFDPVRARDVVYLRVTARHDGGPRLPKKQAQIRALLPEAAADASIRIAGRQGVKECLRVQGTVVSCPITRNLRDGEFATVLLRITVPAGLGVGVLSFRGSAASLAGADVAVRAGPKSVSVEAYGDRPWTGSWRWKAVWATGEFTGTGMRIYERTLEACAEWSWSSGGQAYGSVSGNTWTAFWEDGYGHGRWTLTLQGLNRFTGTQSYISNTPGGPRFNATITGERIDKTGSVLECGEIAADFDL
jgi:hypothetical protein